jgi:hypothetical protein
VSKPEIKVFFKRADGSGYVDLCAFWRGDNGMLRGSLDRRVVAIKVLREDGTSEVLTAGEKGRVEGMFLNCRVEGEQRGAPPARAAAPTKFRIPRSPSAADDFPDDDSIPF